MPDLLTTHAAAAYLHVSPRTLEKWRLTGGGPRYRKLVHRVVYTQDDIDTWVEEQARASTSDPGPLHGPPPHPQPPTPLSKVHALPPRRRGSRAKY